MKQASLLTSLALAAFAAGAQAQVANDDCPGAIPVANGVNGPFSNAGATDSLAWTCGATASSDVWFVYQAPCTGAVSITTCNQAGFDTKLQAFSGDCNNLALLVCNDDSCGLQSLISFQAVQGQSYLIGAGGYNGAQGSFSLDIACNQPLSNDECATAIPIGLGPNGPFSNVGSSTSAPAWPCGAGGNDVWFSFTLQQACIGDLVFTTCNGARTYDTTIEVFDGTCSALNPIVCNDDGGGTCGLGSRAAVLGPLVGTTYYVRVGGFGSRVGSFRLDVYFDSGAGVLTNNGGGCGAATLSLGGAPSIGGYFEAQMGGQVGALQFLWVGAVPINVPLCAGCTIVPNFDITFSGSSFSTLVPCDPTLIGGVLGMQGADLVGTSGGCNLSGLDLTLTNDWTITIG